MLAQFLNDRLTQLHITQAEAARQCRITPTMIHNLLSGNHRVPRPETMKKISTGLRVPMLDLYRAAGVDLPAPESMGGGSAWLRVAESITLDQEQESWLGKIEEDETLRVAFEAAVRGLIDFGRATSHAN